MKKVIVLFLLVASSGIMNAQNAELDKYKSLFTLNFIRYIGWSEEAKEGDFIIGVLKNSIMAEQLKEKTNGKKLGFQNIVIKEFKNIDEVSDCQTLYVDGRINYAKNAKLIASKLNNSNSLIVTEDAGAISDGSMINFVIVDEKLKFEVSANNANKYGLKFSNSLMAMKNAIKV